MKKPVFILLFIVFILSACSICYELILAQALTAFLGNTVLRYSVTIGLYLFSMGIGSWLVEEKFLKNNIFYLKRAEFFLSILGGGVVIWLYCLDNIFGTGAVFSFLAHALIILIGILTGLEVPSIIHCFNQYQARQEHKILALNALGAFAGTVLFAFVLYKELGLLASSFILGSINILTIFLLDSVDNGPSGLLRKERCFLAARVFILAGFIAALLNIQFLDQYFFNIYVAKG